MQTVDSIIMKPIDEVIPYEKNPRKNSKTVELLCKVIPKVGFNVPLVIDKNNVIVKGHARWLAAKQLGMELVPCVVTDADPEAVKADRIADNKVFEFSQWINEELMHEVDMLDMDFNPAEFGLPTMQFDGGGFDFVGDEDDTDISDPAELEEKRRRFMEQLEAEAVPVQITTQQEIDHAKARKAGEATKDAPQYISVTCEKCGHVFFVRKGDAMEWE